MTNLEWALEYAGRGWAVFPIKERDKIPLTAHGFKDASKDSAQITEWWSAHPNANIGIATGQISGGLVVIDLDVHEETGESGIDTLGDWESENGCLPDTWRTITGRGGSHILFISDQPIKNRTNCMNCIDIRGDGGYIVVPPSIHPNGNRYEWEYYDDDCELANIKDDESAEYFFEVIRSKEPAAGQGDFTKTDFSEQVNEGGRNDRLFKYGASLQSQGFSDDDIRAMMEIYNEKQFNPPLKSIEVDRTINSVLSHSEWKEQKDPETDQPKKKENLQHLRKAKDLKEKEMEDLRVIVGVGEEVPFLVEGTCILSAKSKLGKSWLMLEMCDAISKGKDFLGYKTDKCSTLYLDLETIENLKKKRLKKLEGITGDIADCFYIQDTALRLGDGLEEEIDNYMSEDPDIGVIVIDVFQKVLKPKKANVSDYEYYYDKIGVLNGIARKYHISIILVCHDRKTVDITDPFANILGSTALQGATDQMIVMYKTKFNDPITHIVAKGRTIDGLPEINGYMENGLWIKTDNVAPIKQIEEYKNSDIYNGLMQIIKTSGAWEGRCSKFVNDCKDVGIVLDLPEDKNGETDFRPVGAAFNDLAFQELLKRTNVTTEVIKNGSGSKMYRFTVDTVDTVDEWMDTVDEKPFE